MIKVRNTYNTKSCGEIRILRYSDYQNIEIEFVNTGYKAIVKGKHVMDGQIKDPFYPFVYGKGFLGKGGQQRRDLRKYKCWTSMLQRCYDESYLLKRPTYANCEVCDSWFNFQNFGAWFDENYIDGWCLDKDILHKGNKLYSPENCCFVPEEINNLFTKSNNQRGKLPIGVVFNKLRGNFKSCIKINGKNRHLGTFNTIQTAFAAYKSAKEINIERVATKYKNSLPLYVYDALIKYEVDIND